VDDFILGLHLLFPQGTIETGAFGLGWIGGPCRVEAGEIWDFAVGSTISFGEGSRWANATGVILRANQRREKGRGSRC
jgi:hypothetical protein